jgi:L-alanine-DL-glutamate epimerase-like enolase superfamily enzyme
LAVKIVDVSVRVFTYKTRRSRDSAGHAHPGPETDARHALLTIRTDDGSEGHCLHAPEVIRPFIVDNYLKTVLLGQDPFDRERLWQGLAHWQRGSSEQLTDKALAVAELALWDLAGRKLGLPVIKLIGGYRDKILAYGSTMCGDELEGGLATPEDYGRFAEQLVKRGYKGIKLHTWMPPVSWAPDPKMDVKACAAVREAVGPDIALMLDAYHWYSRTDALYLGRELHRLGYAWFEEPMDEASMSSYAWLTENLEIPVLGPETMEGKFHTRAEWVKNRACDILRVGVFDVGGIGPGLKTMHLAESFGMHCEVHGGGVGNLSLCLAAHNCDWYERGLLHPFLDYDQPPAYLNSIPDMMDQDGYVHASTLPGLGEDINFDYIDNNLVG